MSYCEPEASGSQQTDETYLASKRGPDDAMTRPTDIRDGICAYLMGGLGNQLFILAAAWAQAERLQCPLYIDRSRFLKRDRLERPETPWGFELGALNLPGRLIGLDSPWLGNSPRRPWIIRHPGSQTQRLTVYRQPHSGYDAAVNTVRPGTTLLGYFQSPRYFEKVADRMRLALEEATLTEQEESRLADLAGAPRISVHVRRGDYLKAAALRHHGLAAVGYFQRSLALMDRLQPGVGGRVFSDDLGLAQEELSGCPDLEFWPHAADLGLVATIRAMSSGVGFVMSNSSFSWWAAWLMVRQRPTAPVIAPRPWVAGGDSGHDLLLPDWITLDAR
jgi:hypothetical protein